MNSDANNAFIILENQLKGLSFVLKYSSVVENLSWCPDRNGTVALQCTCNVCTVNEPNSGCR